MDSWRWWFRDWFSLILEVNHKHYWGSSRLKSEVPRLGCSKANPGRIAPRQHQFIDQKISILLINPVKKRRLVCRVEFFPLPSCVYFVHYDIDTWCTDGVSGYLGSYSSPVKFKGIFFHPLQIAVDYDAALFWLDLEACMIPLDDICNNVILFWTYCYCYGLAIWNYLKLF